MAANWWDDSPVVSAGKPSFDRAAALSETDKALNLPAGFSAAQIQVESGGKPKARSPAGAMGLAQVMPATLAALSKRLGRDLNPDDEQDAVTIHREVMRENLAKFKDPAKALMAYNGGWDQSKWGNPETSAYVGKVQAALKGQQNPVVRGLNAATNAMIPSANAAQPAAAGGEDWWSSSPVVTADKPAAKAESGDLLQGAGNLVAGAVRGAGSIGATLLSPIDAAARAVNGGKPISVGGFDIAGQDRRAGMDAGLTELGAQPDSMMFKGGKLAGEIAGTAGAGGLVAQGIGKVAPAAVTAAPRVAQALEAIKTGGFSLGTPAATTLGGKAADLALRTAGGALSGGVSAGLVDPEQAKGGAIVGGVLPGAAQAVGMVTNKLGRIISGPGPSADALAAIKAARDAGYVIPPSQAKPTLVNRLLEGFSGKITTAQNASARNEGVTNALANKALGLADDVKLTPEVLQDVRKAAGQAYDALGQAGTITPGASYNAALDKIAATHLKAAAGFPNAKASPVIDLVESLRSPAFDASSAIAKIKELRSAADDAFRTGNTDIGRASKSAATALEDAIEQHLQQSGAPELLQQFKNARQLIAKSYSVEKALNVTTGAVDARKLGAQLSKGKPLSDELRQAGEFANRFPKAAQTVEKMGSLPQTSPLDWAAGGAISAATSNPLALVGVAARPAARALTLSKLVQNNLAKPQSSNRLIELLSSPEGQQLLYRMAPQIATSSR